MLAELKARADTDGRVLTVYTSPSHHVAWYRRNGFEVRAAIRPAPDMHTRLLVARHETETEASDGGTAHGML